VDNEDVALCGPDGKFLPGWPMRLYPDLVRGQFAVDLNQDGYDEVAFIAAPSKVTGKPGGVYVVDRLGKPLPGWPVLTQITTMDAHYMTLAVGI
jgi:hypothetical protein